MAEFLGAIKPEQYDRLTKTQRSWIIVGAAAAVIAQSLTCYIFGLLLHQLPH